MQNRKEGTDSLIYPKELAAALQRSVRWAQRLFLDIRYVLGKAKHQFITRNEVADYLGIPPAMLS